MVTRVPLPGEEPLPGLEAYAPRARRAATGREEEAASRIAFRRYNKGGAVKDPFKCDACVNAMVKGGKWAAPNLASHHITGPGMDTFLCFAHASDLHSQLGKGALHR